jgi:Right handed beta helix region
VRFHLAILLLCFTPALHALDCHDLFRAPQSAITVPARGCDLNDLLTVRQSGLHIKGASSAAQIRLRTPSAGLRIENARNVHIESLTIASSVQSGSAAASVLVIGDSPGFVAKDVTFTDGGKHLNLVGAHNFLVEKTRHRGSRTEGFVIYCYECRNGVIDSPQIDGFVVPAGGPFRAIEILQSEDIRVKDPVIRDIDARSQPNYAGVDFTDSHNSSLAGGTITGLINSDGVLVGRSTQVTISGVRIENNSGHPQQIPGGGTGSGIDVFGASGVTIGKCIVRHNGHSPNPGSRHHGLELYQSNDLYITDTIADDSGKNGIFIYGSQRVKIVGGSASHNQEAGLYAFEAAGRANVTGNTVTLPAQDSFGSKWPPGTPIKIADATEHIAAVIDPTHLRLDRAIGNKPNVKWSVQSSVVVIGGTYNENGSARLGRGFNEGILIGDRTQARLQGVRAADDRPLAQRTQRNHIRAASEAAVTIEVAK